MKAKTRKERVRIRGIALPNEHGSWGILAEPLIAAIAVAPSVPGAAVILVFVGVFLVRQPLKVVLADLLASRMLPRTAFALKCLLMFSAVFAAGIAGSLVFGRAGDYLAAAAVVPFGVYQVYVDVGQKSRRLIPELTGAIALSSSAAVIAIAGGWEAGAAVALWGIMCARLISSILYVRNRLQLEKGKQYSLAAVVVSHSSAFLFVSVLSIYGLASFLTVAVFGLMLVRSVAGLSSRRTSMKAVKIGIWEVVYGLLTVLSVIIVCYLYF